jgi:hypothetical protein
MRYQRAYGRGHQITDRYREGLRQFLRKACRRAGIRYGSPDDRAFEGAADGRAGMAWEGTSAGPLAIAPATAPAIALATAPAIALATAPRSLPIVAEGPLSAGWPAPSALRGGTPMETQMTLGI